MKNSDKGLIISTLQVRFLVMFSIIGMLSFGFMLNSHNEEVDSLKAEIAYLEDYSYYLNEEVDILGDELFASWDRNSELEAQLFNTDEIKSDVFLSGDEIHFLGEGEWTEFVVRRDELGSWRVEPWFADPYLLEDGSFAFETDEFFWDYDRLYYSDLPFMGSNPTSYISGWNTYYLLNQHLYSGE